VVAARARLLLPVVAIATQAVVLIDLAAVLSSLLVGRGIPTLSGGWVVNPHRSVSGNRTVMSAESRPEMSVASDPERQYGDY
jgi:hypothetical protein